MPPQKHTSSQTHSTQNEATNHPALNDPALHKVSWEIIDSGQVQIKIPLQDGGLSAWQVVQTPLKQTQRTHQIYGGAARRREVMELRLIER